MNCKELNFINNKKELSTKNYNYCIVDTNSLTVVPFLNSDQYQSTDRINITPFVKTIKFYVDMKCVLPNTKFIFVFDGGISSVIKKIFNKYKSNRSSRKTMSSFDGNKNKIYDYNVYLLEKILNYFNEIVIPGNFICNEADFICGYLIKNILNINNNNKILAISHDKDFLMTFKENVHVIYKYTAPSIVKNYYVDNFDCITEIIDFPYIKNIEEYILYKALIGDTSDNIDKPFGFKTIIPIKNLFTDSYLENKNLTYDSVSEYFKIYFNNDNIYNKFLIDFRRNLFLMNIFNDEIIADTDKIKLNNKLDDILYPERKEIEINSIYETILEYGLYFNEEEIDDIFKYLKT